VTVVCRTIISIARFYVSENDCNASSGGESGVKNNINYTYLEAMTDILLNNFVISSWTSFIGLAYIVCYIDLSVSAVSKEL
jgi:hypothetical protein